MQRNANDPTAQRSACRHIVTSVTHADRQRLALRARIAREFAIVDERVEVAPGVAVAFARIADADAVLTAACASEADVRAGRRPRRVLDVPYWAGVWPSALAIGAHLAARREAIAGRSLLDLGCGTGLAGAIAATLGARVTLVDREPAALLFARLNTLAWNGRVRRCDWQADDLGERFDAIVGSDVLYEPPQWPFIDRFLRKHLADDGVVFLGEPGRPKSEPFVEWIRARGWSVTRTMRRASERDVQVLELSS